MTPTRSEVLDVLPHMERSLRNAGRDYQLLIAAARAWADQKPTASDSDSGSAAGVTRTAVQAAIGAYGGLRADPDFAGSHPHLGVLLAAAEKLLAMRSATSAEVVAAADEKDYKPGTYKRPFVAGWAAAEARLLPFADEPATPAPTETR